MIKKKCFKAQPLASSNVSVILPPTPHFLSCPLIIRHVHVCQCLSELLYPLTRNGLANVRHIQRHISVLQNKQYQLHYQPFAMVRWKRRYFKKQIFQKKPVSFQGVHSVAFTERGCSDILKCSTGLINKQTCPCMTRI